MRLEIRNLGFTYKSAEGFIEVLRDIDLTIDSGSFHALVGPSGCGKSTLLRILAGLEQPDSGSFEMVGTRRFLHPSAMAFETPRLLPWWNVERNVGLGGEFSGKPKDVLERIRDFYTAHVGLGGLGKRMPETLSRGQQSRAGVGRALAHEADVLLMDEPFTHLDAISKRKMQKDLERLWMIDGRTTVLVTHDIEEAVMLGDRVSVMQRHPGPLLETIVVDAPRPRFELPIDHPGLRSAVGRVWEALQKTEI